MAGFASRAADCVFDPVKAKNPLVNPGLDWGFVCMCQQSLIDIAVQLIKRNT